MLEGPAPDDHENMRWVAFAASAYLRSAPDELSASLRLVSGGDADVRVSCAGGAVAVDLGDSSPAELNIEGSTWAMMGLVSGELSIEQLSHLEPGASVDGPSAARRRVGALIAHNAELGEDAR